MLGLSGILVALFLLIWLAYRGGKRGPAGARRGFEQAASRRVDTDLYGKRRTICGTVLPST